MTEASTERPAAPAKVPLAVIGVVALVLALRLLQWSSAAVSPLTYQLGPDEEYYFRFARAVASGGANTPEFTFMDPGYGYLLGELFKLMRPSVFLIFGLQCLLDAATAVGIVLIGRELGRSRAGLIGALLYGFCSIAIMFSCSVLKEVWVSALMTWWVLIALLARRRGAWWLWALLGLVCGIGVALRSTLVLLAAASLLLALMTPRSSASHLPRLQSAGLLTVVLLVALLPWSLRNERIDGTLSPLPHNSGIVLHQVYNVDNPESGIWIPPFVNYLNPTEIWRGYAAEAERRVGMQLSPSAVNAYWKANAIDYMEASPLRVLGLICRKALAFLASNSVPINRSLEQDAMFSPVIKALPDVTPLLLALGLSGLVWFAIQDARWKVLVVPLGVGFWSFALFFAEDRFRYHVLAVLALLAGIGIDASISAIKSGYRKAVFKYGAAAGALCVASFALSAGIKTPPLHWDQIVWGYIKMGRPEVASAELQRALTEQPENPPLIEAAGYLAVLRQDYSAAAAAYRKAVILRPRSDLAHFNLAKALLATGARDQALQEAHIAQDLRPDPDYQALVRQLETPQ